jgi:primosomal protein N' (replication factor Y)
VIVQTRNPSHYAIQNAVSHDFAGFCRQELEFRREAGYPPFAFLACLSFSGTSEKSVEARGEECERSLRAIKSSLQLRVEILGPAMAPLYRLRGRFRRQILLKSASRTDLRRIVTAWRERREPASTVREQIDIDPVDMM